jgi:hypothetical protein
MTLSSPKPQGNSGKDFFGSGSRSNSRSGSRSKQAQIPAPNLPVQANQPRILAPVNASVNAPANTPVNPGYSNQNPPQQPKLPVELPVKLERLLMTKQITRVVALSLISAVLYLHGSTVIMNNEWNDKRQKVEKLQRIHREIIAATENLNHGLSLSGKNGLQNKYSREKPDKVIFLPSISDSSKLTQKDLASPTRLSPEISGSREIAISPKKANLNSLLVNKQPLAY